MSVQTEVPGTIHEADAHRYDFSAIEPKWREAWEQKAIYKVDDSSEKPKWYSLTMYPYPSGILHVGHWYAFAVPDVFARRQLHRAGELNGEMAERSKAADCKSAAFGLRRFKSCSLHQKYSAE